MSESDVKEIKGIGDLSFDPANANSGTPRGQQIVEDSLRTYGAGRSILVDKNGVAIAGNKTLQSASDIELPIRVIQTDGHELVVVQRTDLDLATDPRARELGLVDNRSSEVGLEWNIEVLASMKSEGIATERLWTEKEWNLLVPEEVGSADADVRLDQAEALNEKWQVEIGDLFTLGNHRLLCGDCTKGEDVARVMGGRQAVLMNTDPPYGVGLDLADNHAASNSAKGIDAQYRTFTPVTGDELTGEQLQRFLEIAIRAAVPHLVDSAAFYLWHPMLTQGTFFAAAAAADILIHRQIIWVKPHFIFGRGDYHWRHELSFYGWRRGFRPAFYGERNQDTVWILDEGGGSIRKDQNHPTQKPVELFTRPILNHSLPGELIYEPFAGSGSQYVAAEQTERHCAGLEIEAKYCAVVLERMTVAFPSLKIERHKA